MPVAAPSDFAHLLDGPTSWPEATAVFADPATGAYLGFVIALRGTDERTGSNTGSLALHRAVGFIERERKQMYDLTAV